MRCEKLIEHFLATGQQNNYWSYNTTEGHRGTLNLFRRWLISHHSKGLLSTKREDAIGFLEGAATISSATRNARTSILKRFYRFLALEGRIDSNPFAGIRPAKLQIPLPNVLSEIEVKRLLESTHTNTSTGLRDRAILELLYATGLRIGELVLLDITSLNLVDKYVVVRAKTSKSRSDRIIPFGEVAQYWVNRYINEVRSSQYRMRVASGSSANFVFLGKGEGGMLNTRTCHLIVARQAKRAGITKRVCPHTLRHSFATHLLNGGANLIVIQKLLGHVNVETTQIYTHTSTLRLKKIHSKHHPRGGNFDNMPLEKGRHYELSQLNFSKQVD